MASVVSRAVYVIASILWVVTAIAYWSGSLDAIIASVPMNAPISSIKIFSINSFRLMPYYALALAVALFMRGLVDNNSTGWVKYIATVVAAAWVVFAIGKGVADKPALAVQVAASGATLVAAMLDWVQRKKVVARPTAH